MIHTPRNPHTHPCASALTGAWFKSSRSGGEQNCVEVADLRASAGVVAVCDSKDMSGPALLLSAGQFATFTQFAAGFEV